MYPHARRHACNLSLKSLVVFLGGQLRAVGDWSICQSQARRGGRTSLVSSEDMASSSLFVRLGRFEDAMLTIWSVSNQKESFCQGFAGQSGLRYLRLVQLYNVVVGGRWAYVTANRGAQRARVVQVRLVWTPRTSIHRSILRLGSR